MSERKDLPPATSVNFLPRVREELAIMMGNRGEPLDQTVRFKDLVDSKMLLIDPGFAQGNGGNRPIISGPGTGAAPVYVVDLTPPPTPTGFTASAAISNLFVQHDPALFTMGHGYLRTILYGASRPNIYYSVPTFANAVQLTQFIGPVASYATNPSTIWHLWIKWVSVDGVLSVSPAGGTNGVSVTTGQDVQLLINALTGQITASQLFADLGARINLIDAAGTGLITRLSNEILTRGSTDNAINSRIDTVISVATDDRGAAGAAITSEATARVNADGALGVRVDSVVAVATSDRGTAAAAVTSEATARANADGALSTRVDSVQAVATSDRGTAAAAITSEQTARANADSALSTRVDTVQAVAISDRGTFTAAIATEQTARANADGTLFAQYSVKVDVNGYVSGFGLSSTAVNAVPTSAFAVRADMFYIASPNGPGVGPTVPFIVRTTPTTINGVNVPVGVYMQDSFIANGTITNAKIGTAAIDDAKIANLSASKITAGSISVGAYINSSSYIPGSQGWSINGNGQAEFSGVVIRGTVYAQGGTIGGCYITGNAISSLNFDGTNGWSINQNGAAYFGNVSLRGSIASGGFTGFGFPAAGQTGFYLGAEGLLLGNANDGRYVVIRANGNIEAPGFNITNGVATFSGTLQGASGTFSGSLSAARGTFSGLLTADAINAVSTINIAGNAVATQASSAGSGGASVTLYIPPNQTMRIVGLASTSSANFVNSGDSSSAILYINGAIAASDSAPASQSGDATYYVRALTLFAAKEVTAGGGGMNVVISASGTRTITVAALGTLR